ncbi:hypothetical protein NKI59_26860, partial [Mesorhizobium sp. M0598]|uniref:hypothetical protein n=1 Tax=Mesorhizobium sp. M0598 TaxID=2956968 RepID=UPI00333BC986
DKVFHGRLPCLRSQRTHSGTSDAVGRRPPHHAVTLAEEPAEQNSAPQRRSEVRAWILGLRRVASLLAPPQDDEAMDVSANRQGM